MLSKNPAQRLRDILENIDAVQSFTLGMDFASFTIDRKTVYAVIRALELFPKPHDACVELEARHSQIDWPAVAAAGNASGSRGG